MGKRNFLWVAVMLLMAGCQKEEAKENTVTPIPTQEETKENAITPIPTQEEIKVLSPTAGVTPELKEELDMEVVYDAVELKGEGVPRFLWRRGKGYFWIWIWIWMGRMRKYILQKTGYLLTGSVRQSLGESLLLELGIRNGNVSGLLILTVPIPI